MDYRDKICTLIHLSKRRYYDTFFENNTVNMKKIHQGISKLSQLICYGYILDTSCILWNNSQLFQQRDPWQPHDQLQSCVPFPFFANPYHRRQLLQGDGLQIDQKISQQFFSKFNLNLQLSVATFSRAFPTSLSLLLHRL